MTGQVSKASRRGISAAVSRRGISVCGLMLHQALRGP